MKTRLSALLIAMVVLLHKGGRSFMYVVFDKLSGSVQTPDMRGETPPRRRMTWVGYLLRYEGNRLHRGFAPSYIGNRDGNAQRRPLSA